MEHFGKRSIVDIIVRISHCNELEMPEFARNNEVYFCVHILTLPSICCPLRGHYQALEKSTVILVSLWTEAARTRNNFIQNLHLMRTLQTFGKSGKTGENYKQVRMSLLITKYWLFWLQFYWSQFFFFFFFRQGPGHMPQMHRSL